MQAQSRRVQSVQSGPHPKLEKLLEKHFQHPYRRPIQPYSRVAFESSLAAWGHRAPLILDAGCGVGESTVHLARGYPDHFVVGVDQSSDRIGRDKTLLARRIPDNLIWVRADLVDFWRLLAEQGIRLARHCLFYPNPWPKAHHLMRRWHAHPVFPVFAALGGVIECRTNWAVYAEEWSFALGRLAGHAPRVEIFVPKSPITPFERKYHASGHVLYRIEQTIPETGGSGR